MQCELSQHTAAAAGESCGDLSSPLQQRALGECFGGGINAS